MDADHAWVEAEFVVKGRTGKEWKVAGVSLYQDVRNYWHLALVEGPGEADGVRSLELKLMKDGHWGAEGTEGSRFATRVRNHDAGWLFGQKYRLRIEKHGTSVRGRVWGERGNLISDIEYRRISDGLSRPYPSLVNGGFDALFRSLANSKALPVPSGDKSKPGGQVPAFYSSVSDSGIDWLIAPGGGKFLSIGCEWAKYREIWCQALGYSPYHRNSEKTFGSEAAWAGDVAKKLRAWGFNTVGQSDRNEEIARQGLAYAPILRMGQMFSDIAAIVPKTFWTGFPDVFDPRFERYCRMQAELKCRPWRDDSNLIGYYIDNELEWFGKDGRPWSLFVSAMKLGPESAAKRAAVEFLQSRYLNIEGFNHSWGCSLASWVQLESSCRLFDPKTREAVEDANVFIGLCAERYFAATTAAVRRADSNHLVLGSRFAWVAPEPAWREAGKHCDIVSFNCYPRVEMPSGEIPELRDSLRNRHRICGKPMMVSEWGFPALDAGLPSTKGAGMRVDDQAQRAYCAARLQEELLGLPFIVGTSWFMWADEPALGVSDSFPENSNYGLVDVEHRPYPHVTSALGGVNSEAPGIHRGSSSLWRSDMIRAALYRKYKGVAEAERPAVRMRSGRLEVDNGEVRLVMTPGKSAGADSILWHGIPMGSYHPLVFQRRGGDGWLAPHRITGFTIEDFQGNGRALEFTAEYAPRDTAWAAFSVKFRMVLPPRGSWFLAEVLEISSLGPRPWLLEGYYHYIPSGILDGRSGDRPNTPTVPNYWLRRGGWFDEKAGLHFGALALEDAGWSFHPYIDSLGGQHPDIFKSVKSRMRRGEACVAKGGPIVIYLGREGRSDPPWTKAAFQAWRWLRAGEVGQQSP
jgi:agarase